MAPPASTSLCAGQQGGQEEQGEDVSLLLTMVLASQSGCRVARRSCCQHSSRLGCVKLECWESRHRPGFAVTVPYLRYCTVLYYTILYCTVLYCTVLYFTLRYCPVLYLTLGRS